MPPGTEPEVVGPRSEGSGSSGSLYRSLGRVAELADAQDSGSCVRKDVGVQVPPRPLWGTDGTKRFASTKHSSCGSDGGFGTKVGSFRMSRPALGHPFPCPVRSGLTLHGTVTSSATRPVAAGPASRTLRDGAGELKRQRLIRPVHPPRSAFTGFRFPRDAIRVAVRRYLHYGLSHRDSGVLLAEPGIEVDRVTRYRWASPSTLLLNDAAQPCRHRVGSCWSVEATYVKVSWTWQYVYRAVDHDGQVIDAFLSMGRDLTAATKVCTSASSSHGGPVVITTDRAIALVRVDSELLPAARRETTRNTDNRVGADHGRLKASLRPMRGLERGRTASIVLRGRAFTQNLRRGRYRLGMDARTGLPPASAFSELALVVCAAGLTEDGRFAPDDRSTQPSHRRSSIQLRRPVTATGPDPPPGIRRNRRRTHLRQPQPASSPGRRGSPRCRPPAG